MRDDDELDMLIALDALKAEVQRLTAENADLRRRDRVLSRQLEKRASGADDYTQSIITAAEARENAVREQARTQVWAEAERLVEQAEVVGVEGPNMRQLIRRGQVLAAIRAQQERQP